MNPLEELQEQIPLIEERLGYAFSDKNLLILAFVHRSFVNEYRHLFSEHNERLEFLGDSVLGLATSDFLFHRLPAYPEGTLSQLRSRLVDSASCAMYLQKLDLPEWIRLGKGEKMSQGKAKQSILADVFEAIIGAIYLDGGWGIVKSFLLCHFEEEVEKAIGSPSRNYKAELQDYSQKKFNTIPLYRVVEETGPAHAKLFHVLVCIEETELGIGIGASKKQAEQRAAFEALSKIKGEP